MSQNPAWAWPEFLVGSENRLVEPAVRSVLEDPASGYNPLLLYGPSGTGKSHLALGLAAEWKARRPRQRVLCTTAADYVQELTDAIKTQAADEFRSRYTAAALLVLEDLDRLAGKPDAQEELVQTLDTLLADNGQVLLTALAAPGRLPGIAPRLRSRLEAGLTVPLASPGPGVRLAVLRRLARSRELELSESAAHLLAEGLPLTVPELCSALVQLETSEELQDGKIDGKAARRFLALRDGRRQVPLDPIAVSTARLFAVELSELRGASRRQAVVTARSVAMYLARQLTAKSLDQVGQYFGGRDHTTVIYSCRKTERLLKDDPAIRRAVDQLQGELQKT
jgi:chromosomal replication initiator protein